MYTSVLSLSGAKGDTRRYRCFHPWEQLNLAGIQCLISHVTDVQLLAKASAASVVIIHRASYNAKVNQLLSMINTRRGLVIYDLDDLVFDPSAFRWIDSPDFQDPLRAVLYQEEMRRNRMTLDECPAVMVSTEYLADQVRQLGKSVWVHRNAFSQEMLALSQLAHLNRPVTPGKLVIGYASGTPTHNRDFATVKPALQRVMRQYPQVELWIVGPLDPGRDWGALESRVKRCKFLPWRALPGLLAQFDINLAPLVLDNPFAQSKSEIKYVEAGLVRSPTVASPSQAYRYAIQDGENGFLASSQQEWAERLGWLVEDAGLRHRIGENAFEDVMRRYHPEVRSVDLLSTLDEISQRFLDRPFAQPGERSLTNPVSVSLPGRQGIIKISSEVERAPTLVHRALYSLRYRGIRTLLMQIWVFLRRLAAPLFPFPKPGG